MMSNDQKGIAAAGAVLRHGGIVAFPTDTVYGLGAVCTDARAVRRIFEAKGRPEEKPLSILVSSISQVEAIAEGITQDARRLMEVFWPGALTLIFRLQPAAQLPTEVTAGGRTIGVRMPDSDTAIQIIHAAGSPLAAPSANLSGKRSASVAEEVAADLNGRIDLIIDGGACPAGIASTVLDISGSELRILREGNVSLQMIRAALKKD